MTQCSAEEIEELKKCYPNIGLASEGGKDYLRIEGLRLPEGCQPDTVTGLLCPTEHSGYSSRLFLSTRITHRGKGTNWNAAGVVILGQQWWAVSWKINAANVRLISKVQAHLGAFTP